MLCWSNKNAPLIPAPFSQIKLRQIIFQTMRDTIWYIGSAVSCIDHFDLWVFIKPYPEKNASISRGGHWINLQRHYRTKHLLFFLSPSCKNFFVLLCSLTILHACGVQPRQGPCLSWKSKWVEELDYVQPHQKGSGTGGGNEAWTRTISRLLISNHFGPLLLIIGWNALMMSLKERHMAGIGVPIKTQGA